MKKKKNVSSLFFVECSSILHVNMLFTIYKVVTVVYIRDNKLFLIENWVILSQNVCVKLSNFFFYFLRLIIQQSLELTIPSLSDLSRYKKYVCLSRSHRILFSFHLHHPRERKNLILHNWKQLAILVVNIWWCVCLINDNCFYPNLLLTNVDFVKN